MSTVQQLVHVAFQTGQPEAMRDRYCTVLGSHVVHAGHGLRFLTFDEGHYRIALLDLPEGVATCKAPTTAALHHTAFTFDTLGDLLARYQALSAAGIEPAVPSQRGVTSSLYCRDSDGDFVELQIDNFAAPDEATAYMRGPEYDADPVGPAFDLGDARRPPRRPGRRRADHPGLGAGRGPRCHLISESFRPLTARRS